MSSFPAMWLNKSIPSVCHNSKKDMFFQIIQLHHNHMMYDGTVVKETVCCIMKQRQDWENYLKKDYSTLLSTMFA
jgi:hypothetical protein